MRAPSDNQTVTQAIPRPITDYFAAQAQTTEKPTVIVRRTVAANLVVSGDVERARPILEAEGFLYHPFINPEQTPGLYLPRSLSRTNSETRWNEVNALLQREGFDALEGVDELNKKRKTLATRRTNDAARAKQASAQHDCVPSLVESSVAPGKAVTGKKVKEPVRDARGKVLVQPDIGWYDLIVVNSSAGKDSIATLAAVKAMWDASDEKPEIVVVHADLGRVVSPGTSQLARAQAEHFGVPFHYIPPREEDLLVDFELKHGTFSTPRERFCTSDHKTSPISAYFGSRLDQARLRRSFRVLNCLGLRGEESANRDRELHLSVEVENSKRTVHRFLPIQHMKVDDVWDTIHESGAPWPIEYDQGNERHSCVFCIFGSEIDWINGVMHHPDLAALYAAIEKRRNHTLKPKDSVTRIALAVGMSQTTIDAVPPSVIPLRLQQPPTWKAGYPIYDRPDKREQREERAAAKTDVVKSGVVKPAGPTTPADEALMLF